MLTVSEFSTIFSEYTFNFNKPMGYQLRIHTIEVLKKLPEELLPSHPTNKKGYGRGRANKNQTLTHFQCFECEKIKRNDFFLVPASRLNKNGLHPYCMDCTAELNSKSYAKSKDAISFRRKALKQEVVNKLGGKCNRCGYNEFLSGLDFHHTGNKDIEIGRLITNSFNGNKDYYEELLLELDKCILLCRNCHSAFHANEWD